MKQRPRRYISDSEMGETLNAMARDLDRGHSAVQGALARTGGIRPPARTRSRLALSLGEREEIFPRHCCRSLDPCDCCAAQSSTFDRQSRDSTQRWAAAVSR